MRAGRHECFDRMVVDFKGGSAAGALGYRVKYVDKLTSGLSEIPVSGGAILQIATGPNYDPSTGSESYPGQHAQPLTPPLTDRFRMRFGVVSSR
ncbi:AMIN-like domain-containing (lipo)protein [Streptomyces sp. SD15]